MKKLFTILLLGAGFGFSSSYSPEYVFICVSKSAEKYHFNKDCRGLKKCTHTIEKVIVSEA